MDFKNLNYENSLWDNGIELVAGVDEVGRGCLAGPLVAAAVVWPKEIANWAKDENHTSYSILSKITDSKKLSLKNRNLISDFVKENCLHYSIIEIEPDQIDQFGIGVCNIKALEDVALQIDGVGHVLVDHYNIFENTLNPKTTSITKGEDHSISIAAASIIAKVHRDNLMKDQYHSLYPEYGFDTHVGYGTKKHKDAISQLGLTKIHRKSFCTSRV